MAAIGTLMLSQTNPCFYLSAVQFLLSTQCFLPLRRTFCHLLENKECHLQALSVWKSPKFVVWERINRLGKEKKLLVFKFYHTILSFNNLVEETLENIFNNLVEETLENILGI